MSKWSLVRLVVKQRGVCRKPQWEASLTGLDSYTWISHHHAWVTNACGFSLQKNTWEIVMWLKKSTVVVTSEARKETPSPSALPPPSSLLPRTSEQQSTVSDTEAGEEHAYLCYETWRIGGRARRGHGNHHRGCPGHGIPYPGRAWKRGEVYNPLDTCTFSLSHLTATAGFVSYRSGL